MLVGGAKTVFVSGPAGPVSPLAVGTVTTGAAGSQAAAAITGAPPNQQLNLTIPKGDQGIVGPAPWQSPIAWYAGLVCVASAPATAVVFGNEAYVCVASHIAGNFATDLAAGRWIKIAAAGTNGTNGANGTNGVQPWLTPPVAWAASTAYTAAAPASSITYNGSSYVCSTSHTSGSTFDASKWTLIAQAGAASAGALQAANNLSDLASAIAAQGNLGELPTPQGRLTLASGTPVMAATVAAAATVYYTPIGRLALVGTGLSTPPAPAFFTEVSQALTDATKSPSAAAASQVYDYFAWNDGGTFRVTRGPAWSAGATAGSNVARGSGAGSTALARVFGFLVNAVAITNGPAAGMGVYVGTIATDASGATVSWSLGGSASNGSQAAILNVWNMHNRITFRPVAQDATGNWTWTPGATFRSINGSNANRITLVCGLAEDAVEATYKGMATPTSGYTATSAVGLDSTTAISTGAINGYLANGSSAPYGDMAASWSGLLLGAHYLQALEGGSTQPITAYGAPYGGIRGNLRA